MVRPEGIEPATYRLRAGCSTNWATDAFGGDDRLRTYDLRIIDPVLWPAELHLQMVLKMGIEPIRCFHQWFLRPPRLPVTPLQQMAARVGLEPTTCRLTAGCSTNWANEPKYILTWHTSGSIWSARRESNPLFDGHNVACYHYTTDCISGGEGGIRTHGPFVPLDFKASSLSLSDTSPYMAALEGFEPSHGWDPSSCFRDSPLKPDLGTTPFIRLLWLVSNQATSAADRCFPR